jgi:hypothetical protein
MEALSFVLSLSFFPPKESYSVVQDAEERREKGVTMNSILNSLFTRVLIGFFFSRVLKKQLFWHIKARENTEREQKREKENSRRRATQTQTRKRKKIFLTFLVEKKMPQITPTISLKTSESTYFLGKFSLTTNDA